MHTRTVLISNNILFYRAICLYCLYSTAVSSIGFYNTYIQQQLGEQLDAILGYYCKHNNNNEKPNKPFNLPRKRVAIVADEVSP